jgi:sialate O-acetylesterase
MIAPTIVFPTMKTIRCLALLALLAPALSQADVRLPAILSDHMVLLRSAHVPVWGWAAPNERVRVEIAGQRREVQAGADGRWRVEVDLSATPRDPGPLAVRGESNAVTVGDVLVGEVWLASGQSNMQKPLGEMKGQHPTFDAEAEIAAADHPDIRLFKVERKKATQPGADVGGRWVRCSPQTIDAIKFSAAAYYFGRKVQDELHAPVGLIDSTVGGTRIELWTPPGALTPDAKVVGNDTPSMLYNGMVAGLAPFALRGSIWYQGESNILDTDDGPAYTAKMAALVQGWRQAWNASFPFYYVQVAPHAYSVVRAAKISHGAQSEPRLWEAQADALSIPGTGMIVTTDLVDDLRDIHPRDKRSVGQRLAALALARTYGRTGIEPYGPVFRTMRVQGDKAILSFEHAAGLAARDGKPLTWFEVAGSDGRFRPATATVANGQVVVSSPEVAAPVTVRFAWNEAAQPNLVNGAGLPAMPFRSDHPSVAAATLP